MTKRDKDQVNHIRDVKAELLDCLRCSDQSDRRMLGNLMMCVEELHTELALARRRQGQGTWTGAIVNALAT